MLGASAVFAIIRVPEIRVCRIASEHEVRSLRQAVSEYFVSVLTRAASDRTKAATYILILVDSNFSNWFLLSTCESFYQAESIFRLAQQCRSLRQRSKYLPRTSVPARDWFTACTRRQLQIHCFQNVDSKNISLLLEHIFESSLPAHGQAPSVYF